jgi:hypothetical protein
MHCHEALMARRKKRVQRGEDGAAPPSSPVDGSSRDANGKKIAKRELTAVGQQGTVTEEREMRQRWAVGGANPSTLDFDTRLTLTPAIAGDGRV